MIYYEGVEDVPLDLTPRDLVHSTLVPNSAYRNGEQICMPSGELHYSSIMTDGKVPVHLYGKLMIEGHDLDKNVRNFEVTLPVSASPKHIFIIITEGHFTERYLSVALTDDKVSQVSSIYTSGRVALVSSNYYVDKIYLTL